MKIGFTGTQKGITESQKLKLIEILVKNQPVYFHHGDCVGADANAHNIVKNHIRFYKIIIHPSIQKIKRTFCHGDDCRNAKPCLERNKDIVDETDLLITCPKGFKEELRSGTWSTIRYAIKQRKKILIIYPDGKFI